MERICAILQRETIRSEKQDPQVEALAMAAIPDFWNDVSGKQLDPDLVITARTEEIEETRRGNLYDKVDISECWDVAGKGPITTRWVDINKGDTVHPEYRSRIVAREMKKMDVFSEI